MQTISNTITLVKNSRGCWDLDVSKGCASGMANNAGGCYGECYANKAFARYGYDFSKTVFRDFENSRHLDLIINQINYIDMPFLRIGVTGDPSENWEHTVNVCEKISACNMVLYGMYKKAIVIITKHWNNLTKSQLQRLAKLGVCINTSVSALDKPELLRNRIKQYNTIKKYCKSILRIVSCDFNKQNETGEKLGKIQDILFENDCTLDTIFRVQPSNKYVADSLINIEKTKFLGSSCYASIYNHTTFFGSCSMCDELCGLTL